METKELLTFAALAASGGFAWFLYGLTTGNTCNGRYIPKACVETLGGLVVGTVVALSLRSVFSSPTATHLMTFAGGTGWSAIIQLLRGWITRLVGDQLKGGD